MKKVFILFICLLSFFLFNTEINADDNTYRCHYDFTIDPMGAKSSQTLEGFFDVDTDKKKITPERNISFGRDYNVLLGDRVFDEEFDELDLISKMEGKCPGKIYACEAGEIGLDGNNSNYFIFLINGSKMDNIDYGQVFAYSDDYYKAKQLLITDDKHCNYGYLNEEESTAEKIDVEFECTNYTNYWSSMEENYCDISSEGCSITKIQTYKKAKNNLKEYCRNKLQYGSLLDQCVSDCLGLSKQISKLEGETLSDPVCGFSERLMSFIANILRWVKYIVPVIVIVLGILDFIKAIGADKDDEMKKAQGRFVKRLIAAALVFIIPLIIEFVLDKMGFGYDDCGLF